MNTYILYTPNTDNIINAVYTDDSKEDIVEKYPDYSVLKLDGYVDVTKYYLDNEVLLPLKDLDIIVNGTFISNLPIPSTIMIDGIDVITVIDGNIELSFEYNGRYNLLIGSKGYHNWTGEIVV